MGHWLVCFENNSNVQGLAGGGGMGITGRDLAPAEAFSDKENEKVISETGTCTCHVLQTGL